MLEQRFVEIQKKIQEIFLSTEWITLQSFIRKNRMSRQ